jgi:hypothetical protein
LGLIVGLAASFSLLLVHFTFQFPTSDYRARLYFLLAAWPFGISAFYFGATFIAGSLAAVLASLRDRWAFMGVAIAAALAVLAIWLHVFSYLVWMHDDDVTTSGVIERVAVAVLIGTGAIIFARRGRLTSA